MEDILAWTTLEADSWMDNMWELQQDDSTGRFRIKSDGDFKLFVDEDQASVVFTAPNISYASLDWWKHYEKVMHKAVLVAESFQERIKTANKSAH